jgi:hypothetical protein
MEAQELGASDAAEHKNTILSRVYSVLKPEGFKKKGQLFTSERDSVVLFIQLQSSTSSTASVLKATVNLGIFSRAVAARIGHVREPSILEAHWRQRIGHLTADHHDKWWTVQTGPEAGRAGDEIAEVLASRALPVMLSLASTEKLKELWQTGSGGGLTEYQRREYLLALGVTPWGSD